MKISVIGCGRWGTFITWYLDHIGHNVSLYGRESSKHMKQLIKERRNDLLELKESILLTHSLEEIKTSEVIVISINAQGLQKLMEELNHLNLENKIFVLCMKGIEISTGRRLTQIVKQNTHESNKIAVWLGPGHVQEFYNGIPNCMVIDSEDNHTKEYLIEQFSSKLIRFYYGQDLIGNEIGAAAKNVIGIAAGMLDGLNLSTLKGALMSRGTREVARLIKAMGGNELSAYGLCHLGDYEATVFSKFSHNRKFGESFVKGENYGDLAEGYYTVKALVELQEQYHIELPICQAVYDVLYKEVDIRQTLENLFSRTLKAEF
ncbi:MAG: NAD(P)H-dependent glycerol-3-phosphate dehydrogenase [Cellulosilyticum sp.]|nr:NAD(P)H-dependent glycerol-3-phosphate dehydrogenase [Cellulosilyticum sp.]MEE1071570.1 NAD(P)H-dependent glycerol-3-phosphate dehydrogenase [Cellulosilyticum sp.]